MENMSLVSQAIVLIIGTCLLFFATVWLINLTSKPKNKEQIKGNIIDLNTYINDMVEVKGLGYAINEAKENKDLGIKSLYTQDGFVYVEISKLNEAINKGFVDRDIIDKIIDSQNLGKSQIHIPKNRLDEITKKLKNSKTPIYAQVPVVGNIDEPIRCPKCSSTQITAEKKGYSAGKALAGAVLTGGIGLLAGFHGSGNIKVICLKCGNSWTPKG